MRDRYLIATCLVVLTLGMISITFPDGASAILIVSVLSGISIYVFRRYTNEKDFVTTLFLGALMVRLLFGVLIHVFDLRDFFGSDALGYDYKAVKLLGYWAGQIPATDWDVRTSTDTSSPGWGMNYLVAFIYYVFGRNILAAQSFCAVFGAATAPLIFYCAQKIFSNIRVAKFASFAIAFFPSFVIWSSQLLKDGLIVFLLVLTITMVLQLQERFNYLAFILLLFSLFGIMSLRFYIFYMVAMAVAGSFIIGMSNKSTSIARRTVALVLIGLGLTYLGVLRNAGANLERYATLERVQNSRLDLAQSAESGFGGDADVSTTEGAISVIPLGFAYLMLAPFPWEVSNLRQAITLPDVLLWWAMIPLLIWGIWYALRNRLRSAFPILFFSLMLTLAYSIFQGNVGTAYRQRTQIQVFLFIFIGVGWELYRERREDRKMMLDSKQRQFAERIRREASISN
jgi:hypothetical protein